MKKCKITVLKRNFDEKLAREYGVESVGWAYLKCTPKKVIN